MHEIRKPCFHTMVVNSVKVRCNGCHEVWNRDNDPLIPRIPNSEVEIFFSMVVPVSARMEAHVYTCVTTRVPACLIICIIFSEFGYAASDVVGLTIQNHVGTTFFCDFESRVTVVDSNDGRRTFLF
ncbi:hypothetical protein AUR66_19735 [Haloferax profundi]|uniref:Uncharacterized protein n=1 Tax=Haloferax profundi TaxID=1544718 RepID=A0A0W1RGA2_9EURY|nr:hypothetical protein AUR66_19735 [Haloferax profundi]